MKRALISQTLHEWKENIWLIIELLIVAVIIWGLTLFVVNSYDFSHRPKAFDITGVFAGNIEIRTSPEEGGGGLRRGDPGHQCCRPPGAAR